MRIVVPGGSGQVGHILARHLHGQHFTVLSVVRNLLDV